MGSAQTKRTDITRLTTNIPAVLLGEDGRRTCGVLENISLGGVFFVSGDTLDPNVPYTLEFKMLDVHCRYPARIRWRNEAYSNIAAKDRPSGYGLQLLGQDARLFGLVYDLRDQASFKVLPIDDAYQARTLERPLQPNDPTWIAARKLRYDTYCKECGFLNAADYPDGLESDLFDSVASQIVCENAAGHIVGNVRLVHFSGLGLPIQRQATSLGKKFA